MDQNNDGLPHQQERNLPGTAPSKLSLFQMEICKNTSPVHALSLYDLPKIHLMEIDDGTVSELVG